MIQIALITEDFKDSNYAGPRACPLYKGLKRLGYEVSFVTSNLVIYSSGLYSRILSPEWYTILVNQLIKCANNGEIAEYTVILEDIIP